LRPPVPQLRLTRDESTLHTHMHRVMSTPPTGPPHSISVA
jgi:hypothetical protein